MLRLKNTSFNEAKLLVKWKVVYRKTVMALWSVQQEKSASYQQPEALGGTSQSVLNFLLHSIVLNFVQWAVY